MTMETNHPDLGASPLPPSGYLDWTMLRIALGKSKDQHGHGAKVGGRPNFQPYYVIQLGRRSRRLTR